LDIRIHEDDPQVLDAIGELLYATYAWLAENKASPYHDRHIRPVDCDIDLVDEFEMSAIANRLTGGVAGYESVDMSDIGGCCYVPYDHIMNESDTRKINNIQIYINRGLKNPGEFVNCLIHEFIHAVQYASGRLYYTEEDGDVWEGVPFGPEVDYDDQPHEVEAYSLADTIVDHLVAEGVMTGQLVALLASALTCKP